MMNWENIVKNYPNSVRELAKYFMKTNDLGDELDFSFRDDNLYISCDKGYCVICLRDLYDFFDEYKIRVSMSVERGGHAWWDVCKDDKGKRYSGWRWYNTRKKAETEAFEKAFKLLEIEINNEHQVTS